MQIKVPFLVQDPAISRAKGITKPIEFHRFDNEAFCLAGPIARRVAVLDFDETTGALRPGIAFVAPDGATPGRFDLADDHDYEHPDFLPVNVFATVLATLYMFEEDDVLGRPVDWAFDSPQLLVVPRAGEWANAFYERESRSLQFFSFPARRAPGAAPAMVHTGLSQDIVAHETAHAIVDGIAPDLYNALSPQSLAIHEAVADLTALLSALRSRNLRSELLRQTGGSISGEHALSRIAEQFGFERDHTGRSGSLRTLWNDRNLDPADTSLDALGRPNSVGRADPHQLSEVLSGALYRVMAHLHTEYMSARAAATGSSEFSASGWALFVAHEHFKRLVLRSLDYLPPGETSFADYGRAILASDTASYADRSEGRDKLVEEFVARRIVDDPRELAVDTNLHIPEIGDLDLESFVRSDWVAYTFVGRNRHIFGIPFDVDFRVHDRLEATKTYRDHDGFGSVRECIVKVSWNRVEPNPADLPLPALRQITVGTTMAIDWDSGRVRAVLRSDAARSDPGGPAPEPDRGADSRDRLLADLVAGNRLSFSHEDDPASFEASARVEVSGDTMRIRGSGRMLHLAPAPSAEAAAEAAAGTPDRVGGGR